MTGSGTALELLNEAGAIRTGHFKASSGLHLDTYVDKDSLTAQPAILWDLCFRLAREFGICQLRW